MDKLMKMKKGKPELSENEKKAKMGVVSDMRDMAAKLMGEKLKGLKKVSVASDSKEGLEEGLEKAKELLDSKHAMPEEEQEGEMEESSEEEQEEMEEMPKSIEEIDAKIQELMDLKEQMKKEEA